MLSSPFLRIAVCKNLQLSNALSPILVTVSGVDTLSSPELEKAFLDIIFRFFGSVIFLRFLHPENAFIPITVTVFGILTASIPDSMNISSSSLFLFSFFA